ncbi:MAG: hypothetical protein CMA68_04350 [Euryarchaeota archaeon]|nr:hypothetical protein [Euryarchaeota archaeon]
MSEPELSPEPWPVHLLGLISPGLAISGNILGGAYTLMGVVFIWGVGPLLDLAMGESKNPRPPRESGTPFEALLWVHGMLHFVMLGSFVYFASSEGLTRWLIAASLSTGLVAAASAIVTAHELGHKRPKSPGWRLARALLFSINYPHFTTEHNHNHHKNVATDLDPASATYEQGIWAFWISTIPGQFASSVRVHNRKGRTGFSNPSWRGLALQILLISSLAVGHYAGLQWALPVLVGWGILSLIAIMTLEYVNYIRHWGLRREDGSRKFEEEHAWNTEARWSRWSLLELTRHSDHHLHASVPFWKLRPYPDAPTLPSGYYACWWPCLVPPIWRRMMRGRAPGV